MLKFADKHFDPHLVLLKNFPDRDTWLRALYRANMAKIRTENEEYRKTFMTEDQFVRATYEAADELYQKDIAKGILQPEYDYIRAAEKAIGGIFMTKQERMGANIYYHLQRYANKEFVAKLNAAIPEFRPGALYNTKEKGVFIYANLYRIDLGSNDSEGWDDPQIELLDPETAWHYLNFGERI